MKVIKRDGHMVDFCPDKIEQAILKANKEVDEEEQASAALIRAIVKYIEKLGDYPIILNWIPDDLYCIYKRRVSEEQNKSHADFAKRHYKNITKECKDKYDIARVIDENKIDIVIIGSDAVFSYTPFWTRIRICRRGLWYFKPISDFDCPNPFWGDFYSLVKRPIKIVAMSASAQNTPYRKIVNKKEKNKFLESLKNFSFVSVRVLI